MDTCAYNWYSRCLFFIKFLEILYRTFQGTTERSCKLCGYKSRPEDLILFNSGSKGIFCVFDCYSKRTDLIKRLFPKDHPGDIDVNEENIKELRPTVEGYKRVWIISSHNLDLKGLIEKTLSESYNLSHYRAYLGIEVYVFEKNE